MKLIQEKVFEIISNLRSPLPSHEVSVLYPDENSVAAEISKVLNINIDDTVKGLARYQLKRYKSNVVIYSDFTSLHPPTT